MQFAPKVKTLTIQELAARLPEEFRERLIEEFNKRTESGRKIRIYSDGCFDLFHYGHARQFRQIHGYAENLELVAGVCGDSDILEHKGAFVMSAEERAESVAHCRWVDEVICPCPWTPTLKFMDDNHIDFIAHDTDPYAVGNVADCYAEMKLAGRFLPTLRTEGVSTSDVMVRILKEKEDYIDRNLKKGYSRGQMNLNYLEYAFIKYRNVYHILSDIIDKKIAQNKQEE